MTPKSADASFYYHEDTAADVVRMDSSAVYGNLADSMQNATVPLPLPQIIQTVTISSPSENSNHQVPR